MPSVQSRPLVWAEINLTRLQNNLAIIRSFLGEQTKLLGVVKHDAYGHGACVIGKFLAANGVDYLGVGRVAEGIELRRAGIALPVLVMGVSLVGDAETIVRYQLTPMVCDLKLADALQHYCDLYQRNLRIQLRVDASRGGIGVLPEQFERLLLEIGTKKRLQIEGIFAHLVSAYSGARERITAEIADFKRCMAVAAANGIRVPLVHVSSSPGILRVPEANFTMVRTGTALLGLPSFAGQKMNGLEPVMQLKTRIIKISRLSGLLAMGYSGYIQSETELQVAVLPLGYGDAPFLLSLRDGEVLVRGERARILGKPCMGHLLIDVTKIAGVAVDDEVVVFGQQQDQYLGVAEQAEKSGIDTVCCESLCCLLGKQVKRIYSGVAQLPVAAKAEGEI